MADKTTSDYHPTGSVLAGFEPQQSKLAEGVAQHIRGLIFDGHLKPSTRVNQEELATELGVSRLPIRQALAQLEQEGLVDHLPNRGTFVSELSREDIRDHFIAFGLISGLAAMHAAERITDAELAHLAELNEAMHASPLPSQQEQLNWQFHINMNRASRSRRVQSILRALSKSIPPGFYTESWLGRAYEEHEEIIQAMRNRDAPRAQAAMVSHLHSSGDHAVRLLESAGFWSPAESAGQPVKGDRAGRKV